MKSLLVHQGNFVWWLAGGAREAGGEKTFHTPPATPAPPARSTQQSWVGKPLPYIAVVISLICSLPIITIAAPVVRTIKQTQASGQTATLQTINVWNGHGVAISFYQV